jgi:hypothetical protein
MVQTPGMHGIIQGWLLFGLLMDFDNPPASSEGGLWYSTGLSLAGSTAGFLASRHYGFTPGQAILLGSMMTCGYLYGLATAAMIEIANLGGYSGDTFGTDSRMWFGLPLLFSDAMAASSFFFWNRWKVTEGTVTSASVLAIATAYAVGYVLDLLGLWEKGVDSIAILNTDIAAVMLSHFSTYILAMQFSRDKHLSAREGSQIGLSILAGGAFGAGLDYLFGYFEPGHRRVWPALPLAGMIAGWLWTYRSIVSNPDRDTASSPPGRWDVQFDPTALAINALAKYPGPTLPFLRASYSF